MLRAPVCTELPIIRKLTGTTRMRRMIGTRWRLKPGHRNSVPQSHNVTAEIPDFMGAAQPIPHDEGYLLGRGRRGGGGP